MNWVNTSSNGDYTFSTAGGNWTDTQTLDLGTPTTTLELPDPLIDWLPYKWKKYIPTWYLVRSYK